MSTHAATPASRAFWRAYWVTVRPYLFFVSGISGLVGLALVPDASLPRVAAAFLAFFFSYGLGQALTDTTQLDTDSISSPYRPLVRGAVTPVAVRAVSLAGLAACAIIFAASSLWTLPLSAAAVGGLATYTPLKRRWWGGPFWNSWIVGLLPIMGALCAGAPVTALTELRTLSCAASVFFSYAVFVLLGYLKDVEADRATGYCTLPVRFGRRATVATSAVSTLAALSASLLIASAGEVRLEPAGLAAALLWLTAVVWLVLAHTRLWSAGSDDEAHPGIGLAVRGFVALHAAEVGFLRPELTGAAVLLVVLFELALARRPCREQI